MTTFTFGGVSSTTIPEIEVLRVRRPLVADRRDEFVAVPGREGAWLFPEKPGMRTITLDLHLLAETFEDRRSAVIEMADLLDVAGMARLIVDDEADRFHLARLASAPDPEEWLTAATFSVDFVAEPYSQALEISESEHPLVATTDAPFSFTVPDRVEGVPVVELIANGGTVTMFTLTLNGETLIYEGPTIASGDAVTISTLAYVVTAGLNGDAELDGTFDPDDLSMSGVSGDFPYVVPGDNEGSLTRTGAATSVTVRCSWRRRSR